MKFILVYTLITSFWVIQFHESPSDYESKLSSIANELKDKIMDKNDCQDLMYEASTVAENIENVMQKDDEYSESEIALFKIVRKKAQALESFIGEISGCSSTAPTIEDFKIANRMVGASAAYAIRDKFCVDFITVTINKYVVYLGENNTDNNNEINYKWKAIEGNSWGNGTTVLIAKSVRHIYDNREKPSQNRITISNVSCKPF